MERPVIPPVIRLVLSLCVIVFTPDITQAQSKANPSDTPAAVPEQARGPYIEGIVIAKSAKDAKSQLLAVESFKEATKIGPWWGDAYYNLAIAQELAGQLDDAQQSLRFYILTLQPGDKEAQEAQDRIYALNAKKKLVAAEASQKEEAEKAKELSARKLDISGIWKSGWMQYQFNHVGTGSYTGDRIDSPGGLVPRITGTVRQTGKHIVWQEEWPSLPGLGVMTRQLEMELSDDGNRMRGISRCSNSPCRQARDTVDQWELERIR